MVVIIINVELLFAAQYFVKPIIIFFQDSLRKFKN